MKNHHRRYSGLLCERFNNYPCLHVTLQQSRGWLAPGQCGPWSVYKHVTQRTFSTVADLDREVSIPEAPDFTDKQIINCNSPCESNSSPETDVFKQGVGLQYTPWDGNANLKL